VHIKSLHIIIIILITTWHLSRGTGRNIFIFISPERQQTTTNNNNNNNNNNWTKQK